MPFESFVTFFMFLFCSSELSSIMEFKDRIASFLNKDRVSFHPYAGADVTSEVPRPGRPAKPPATKNNAEYHTINPSTRKPLCKHRKQKQQEPLPRASNKKPIPNPTPRPTSDTAKPTVKHGIVQTSEKLRQHNSALKEKEILRNLSRMANEKTMNSREQCTIRQRAVDLWDESVDLVPEPGMIYKHSCRLQLCAINSNIMCI
jgi:hypothetical protein